MKDISIKGFLGLNNVLPPEDFQVVQENFKTKGFYLQTAQNLDVDNSNYIRRRVGYDLKASGGYHSLWSNGDIMLVRTGNSLVSYNESFVATTLRSDMVSTLRTSYISLNGNVYYSDGAVTGVTDGGTDRTWGMTVPLSPVVASSWGSLLAGTYQVVLTHRRADGQESGAPLASRVTLTATGGISITLPIPTTTDVTHINVYVTRRSGEIFYLLSRHAVGTTSTWYGDEDRIVSARELKTQHLSPPMPGQVLAYYRGRVYIADGDTLWYSEPYAYELFNLRHNYIQFESDIAVIGVVANGLFIGTETEISFLEGMEPKAFKVKEVAEYGAIFGSVAAGEAGQVIMATKEGICIGGAGGEFKNISQDFYHYDAAFTGATLYQHQRGIQRLIVSLRGTDIDTSEPYRFGETE